MTVDDTTVFCHLVLKTLELLLTFALLVPKYLISYYEVLNFPSLVFFFFHFF